MVELPAALPSKRSKQPFLFRIPFRKIITLHQRMILFIRSCALCFHFTECPSRITQYRIIFFYDLLFLFARRRHTGNSDIFLPFYWHKNRDSADGTSVLKKHSIPFMIRRIHNSSLCNALPTISHSVTQYISAFKFSRQAV